MASSNKLALQLRFKNLSIKTNVDAQNSDCQKALTLGNFQKVSKNSSKKILTFQSMEKSSSITQLNNTHISTKFWDLFEKKQKLGEGAHSVVYECMEKSTRKNFAVKIPQFFDAQKVKGIKQTFLISKSLDHPYILKTFKLYFQESNEKCYIVSELCNYEDLRSYIQKKSESGQNFSQEQVVKIVRKILLALKYLKKRGICHRDIKPQNILYEPSTGNLKIIDFELARMKKYEHETLDLWTDTGSLCYRAPQSFAFGYNQCVDTWAVGVIAFQMLTGKLPFNSFSVKGTTNQIKNKHLDYDTLNISNMAKRFLFGLLQKIPINRFTPEEALKSPFILKNMRVGLEQVKFCSQEPIPRTKYSQSEVSIIKRYFDQTSSSTYMQVAQKANGIIIIH